MNKHLPNQDALDVFFDMAPNTGRTTSSGEVMVDEIQSPLQVGEPVQINLTYDSGHYSLSDDIEGFVGLNPPVQKVASVADDLHLVRLYLESYGKYSQRTVETFRPGLNVVFGPNEAGKSTSAQLVKDVLYGWVRKVAGTNDYSSFAGSRSGSLYFANGEGEWELMRGKRNETKVVTHRGSAWPQAFDELCGEVTETTFEDVFSLTSEKLRSIGHDDPEGITSKLLTAGSGTRMAPTQALEHIEERMREITSRRAGLDDALGTLQISINELERLCAEKSEEEAACCAERLELAQAEVRKERLGSELAELKAFSRELSLDCQSAADALAQANDLGSKWKAARQAFEDADEQAEQAALDLREKTLLVHADAVEAANLQVKDLALCQDRADERKREYDASQAELDAMKSSGCLTEASVKQTLIARQKQRVELETAVRYAADALKDAQAKSAGLDAKDTLLVNTPVAVTSSKLLVVLGALAVAAGGIIGVFGFNVASWPGMLGGGVLVALGIALVILGIPRREKAEREAALAQQRRRREEMVEELGHAQGIYDRAAGELARFDQITEDFLLDSQLIGAKSNLDFALAMVETEEDFVKKRMERNAKKEYYAKSYREAGEVAQSIRAHLEGFDEAAAIMADRDYLTYVPALYKRLLEVQDREAAFKHLDEKRGFAKGQSEALARDLAALQARIDILKEKHGIDDSGQLTELLEHKLAETDALIQVKETQFAQNNTRIGELQTVLDSAAQATALQKLREELEEKRALRKRSAKTYAELVMAHEYLMGAIALWEHDRQPKVFKLASELFSDMTRGRWVKVGIEGANVFATDGNYRQLPSYKLSTGTCQQLYLALRVALLISADDVGKGLPVIADDILVNFDAARREGAARALARLAQTRQVIVFTCHRQTQEILRHAAPGANLFDLGV